MVGKLGAKLHSDKLSGIGVDQKEDRLLRESGIDPMFAGL